MKAGEGLHLFFGAKGAGCRNLVRRDRHAAVEDVAM